VTSRFIKIFVATHTINKEVLIPPALLT